MVYEERLTKLAVEIAFEALKADNIFMSEGLDMFEAMSITYSKKETVRYTYSTLVESLKGRKDETIDEYLNEVAIELTNNILYAYTGSFNRYNLNTKILNAIMPILKEKWESIIPSCIICGSLLPARTNKYCSFDCAAESGDFIND